MVKYNPAIIQKFAEKLYASAFTVVIVYTTLGALAGLTAGGFLGMSVSSDARLILWASTGGVGGRFGLMLGLQRAFWLKLQAQLALCQMMIEVNTRKAVTISNHSTGFPVLTE